MSAKLDKLEKIRALVERATHPSTPLHEAEASARIACRLIKEARILESRDGSNPAAGPRTSVGDDVMTIATHLQVRGETLEHYVVRRARPYNDRTQDHQTLIIPKRVIVEIQWMSKPRKKSLRYHDAVIERLIVRMGWFERVTEGWNF